MAETPEFRIYISSTIDDLKEERAAAAEIAGRYGVLIDSYRVTEQDHVDKCIADVRSAHLYIGILGRRYGWIAQEEPAIRSITELEYEACEQPGQPRIPRLMLLRTSTDDADDDSRDTKYPPQEREKRRQAVEAFRARAGKTGIQFGDLGVFRMRLVEAVIDQRQKHFRAAAPGPAIFDQQRHWATALKPVALLGLEGADEVLRQRLVAARPEAFVSAPLRVGEGRLAAQAEGGWRKAQVAMLVLTPAALKMLDTPQRRDAVARLLALMKRRQGAAPVLCLDGAETGLPPDWPAAGVLVLDGARLQVDPAGAVGEVLVRLNALTPLSSQTRLAVPTLVLAPTAAEVQALLADPAGTFKTIEDKWERAKRRSEFDVLVKALRKTHPGWPAGFYGAQRDEWRCFDADGPDIGEQLDAALLAINSALPGSRERELLQQAELLRKPYNLDEYLRDEDGSQAVVVSACDAGALLIVDELALLHPALRRAARTLLAERCAVGTVSACDPAHLPTRTLLGELSFLRVGAVVERFAQRRDLQCELTLNTATRLERWLRGAIPRLVADLAGLVARPPLVSQINKLLET
jgi:hypothetical protein